MLSILENLLMLVSLVLCMVAIGFLILKVCDILVGKPEKKGYNTINGANESGIYGKEGIHRGSLFKRRRTAGKTK